MRVIAAVVVSLVCILALILWLARSEPAAVIPIASASESPAGSPPFEGREENLTSAPDANAAARAPSVTQPAAPSSAVAQGSRCRVFGRVQDENGAPLADVAVSIYPVSGRWSETATIAKTGPPGFERESLKTTTSADGRFSFEAPLPTADWITLQVEPDVYHSLYEREFGPAGGRNKPRIVEGDNDMGDIRLTACGAVSGRILSPDGLPIPRANAAVPDVNAGGRYSNATPDAEGRFLVGHVPAGLRTLNASAQGWIEQRDIPVEVRANATIPVADIVLSPAFSVSGTVVDEAGAPVGRISIWGSQASGPRKAARSADDGSFTLYVEKEEPVSLEVRNAKGFEKWGGGPEARFETGTKDVRIVLRRSVQFTFKVVDALSAQPIERFGLRLEPKPQKGSYNSGVEHEIPIEIHPGGVARVPLSNTFVVVDAPDHAPVETDVVADVRGGDEQTIGLRPGARLRGRLVTASGPFAKGSLLLRREAIDEKRLFTFEPGVSSNAVTYDVGAYSGRPQTEVSAEDGTFEIDGLAPGTYALQVVGAGVGRKRLRGVTVPLDGLVDLGDIVLVAGATISGVLFAGESRSPEGFTLRLYTDTFIGARHLTIDNIDGKFEYAGLEAGSYNLSWSRPTQTSWSGEDPHKIPVTLAEGEVREIVIDARTSEPCKVFVRVTRAGKPQSGVGVSTYIQSGTKPDNWQTNLLGKTDDEGRVVGEVDGDLTFELVAVTDAWQELGNAGEKIRAVPGGRIAHTIEISAGVLVVELPSGFPVPEQGAIAVQLDSAGRHPVHVSALTRGRPHREPGTAVWIGERISFGEFQAGEYDATVTIHRIEPDASKPGGSRYVEMRAPFKTKVTIEADKETKIVVP